MAQVLILWFQKKMDPTMQSCQTKPAWYIIFFSLTHLANLHSTAIPKLILNAWPNTSLPLMMQPGKMAFTSARFCSTPTYKMNSTVHQQEENCNNATSTSYPISVI